MGPWAPRGTRQDKLRPRSFGWENLGGILLEVNIFCTIGIKQCPNKVASQRFHKPHDALSPQEILLVDGTPSKSVIPLHCLMGHVQEGIYE